MFNSLRKKTPANICRHAFILALYLPAVMAICLIASPAHAQWHVVDDQANSTLDQIQDNTNSTERSTKSTDEHAKNIEEYTSNIDKNLHIGAYNGPGERVADPQLALASAALEDGLSRCSRVAENQQTFCKEIVKTQNSQYLYMKTMYDNTKTRNDKLQELLKEREKIGESEFGKLQDNSNKLIALYTLLEIDRQQMESTNYAYEARLRYLRDQLTNLADAASSGKAPNSPDLPALGDVDMGDLVRGMTTGLALKVALDASQSPEPSGMRTLSLGHSDGW